MGNIKLKKKEQIEKEKKEKQKQKEKEKQKKLDDYNAMLDKINTLDDLKNNFVELMELAEKVK